MTRPTSQYSFQPYLTPVRLAATSNQVGTYFNGNGNNGVGATFTYGSGVLTIDSTVVNVGDRVILSGQTKAFQNGIYVCSQAGALGIPAILQRSNDQQSIEQMRIGFYVSVGAGVEKIGAIFSLVEPLPGALGIDDIIWVDSSSSIKLNTPITKIITMTAADLAADSQILVQAPLSSTSSFLVTDIKVLKSVGLSGGGGDRLLQLVTPLHESLNRQGITATLLGTPVLTLWGDPGNPTGVNANPVTAAGDSIVFHYNGGTTDYSTGSVSVAVTYVLVKE
jgi:hypothetical protein